MSEIFIPGAESSFKTGLLTGLLEGPLRNLAFYKNVSLRNFTFGFLLMAMISLYL